MDIKDYKLNCKTTQINDDGEYYSRFNFDKSNTKARNFISHYRQNVDKYSYKIKEYIRNGNSTFYDPTPLPPELYLNSKQIYKDINFYKVWKKKSNFVSSQSFLKQIDLNQTKKITFKSNFMIKSIKLRFNKDLNTLVSNTYNNLIDIGFYL